MMNEPTVTTGQARECLGILKAASGFLTAAAIAAKLRLGGKRETQRRCVRAIVEQLRNDGQWIIAQSNGYYLTSDERVWKDYLEGRKIDSKRVIGEAARRQRMVTDAAGQGLLFGQPAVKPQFYHF